MYHTIRFVVARNLDIQVTRRDRLELARVNIGTVCRAQIKPYVLFAHDGPVEMADLFFEDGTQALEVRFADFTFGDLDEPPLPRS
jgi:hypothetical protein